MAPKRRKPQVAILEDIPEEPAEEPTEKEQPRLLVGAAQSLDELEQKVQEWVQELLGKAEEAALSIRHQFQVELVRLPKQVRDMPLTQFKTQFGGDIKAVLLDDINTRLQTAAMPAPGTRMTRQRGAREPATAAATSRKKRGAAQWMTSAVQTQAKGLAAAAETPSLVRADSAIPSTDMRIPRPGEVFYSARGSPLGAYEQEAGAQQGLLRTVLRGGHVAQTPMVLPAAVQGGAAVATIIHRNRPGSKTGVADGIVITLKDGQQVMVDLDGGLEKVPEAQRAEVATQLSALQKLASSALRTAGARR